MVTPRVFTAKDGRKVTLRSIRWEDLDDLLEFINSLVEEDADILLTKRVGRSEEAEWLGRRLALVANGELIDVVAEFEGKVIANAEVTKRSGIMAHVGDVGIGIKSGYRGIGVGTELMKTLIAESRKAGLRVLVLTHFATNNAARQLYVKMGFKEAGRIPKCIQKKGRYIDSIRMVLSL